MKKILLFFAICASAMAFTGCTLTKQLAYFQNMDSVQLAGHRMMPVIHVKPNDELTILVSSITPEAAEPFNGTLYSKNGGGSSSNTNANKYMNTYIVDTEGFINFPVIGKVNVLGLTRPQVEQKITNLIMPYFSKDGKPVVKVRFSGFKVTVIGETGSSKLVSVDNERMSIIEALASAGDLTVYGKRANILLIREDNKGEKMVARYNLNDANTLNSEFYYLQQNDIVYVEPHKTKARSADVSSYTFWTPISSLALSLATFVLSLTK